MTVAYGGHGRSKVAAEQNRQMRGRRDPGVGGELLERDVDFLHEAADMVEHCLADQLRDSLSERFLESAFQPSPGHA